MASIARQGESPSANAEDTKALAKPAQRPTLRRPDEAPDAAVHQGTGVTVPEHKDGTPQWGSDGQEQPPINTKPPLERWADDKGSGGFNFIRWDLSLVYLSLRWGLVTTTKENLLK